MSAFNDGTCPRCRKRFGWQGKLTDRPPCPKCGHKVDPDVLQRDQEEMDRIERELFGDVEDD
jgi:PHP family Zn ribbon phosphoesterase